MPARALFIIMHIIGFILALLGIKASDKSKLILFILGVVMMLIAVFGILTSLF